MKNTTSSIKSKVFTGIILAVCIILAVILVLNVILIVKSYTNKDEVPGIGGRMPLIVLTDSMYPTIKGGDLIIVKEIDPDEIKVGEEGDIISFFDPASTKNSVLTHRAVDKRLDENGKWEFETKGDYNLTEDDLWVSEDVLIGVYQARLPLIGHVAMFMQSTPGFIICVGTPIIAIVVYDVLRRRKQERESKADTDALLLELAALRAEKENKENKD